MAADDPAIVGPQVLVPGSDFFLLTFGRLLLLLGGIALIVAIIVRVVRNRRRPDHRGRPVALVVTSAITLLGLVLTVMYWPPPYVVPEFPALPQLLPSDAVFYRRIDDLPVSPDSDRWIAAQGGLTLGNGSRDPNAGVPFNLADSSTPMIDVELTQYPEASYPGPYPMTDPAYIEGLPTYHFDQHYLAMDLERRTAWELIATRRWFGRWQAGAGASWSMDSLDYPHGTSIAAGLPLLPGMYTYEEVASGSIDHLILGATSVTAPGKFIWPARGGDGVSTDPDAPPMGAWLRLKADTDLSGLGPQATIIARAAQQYGVLLSDTGPGFGLRGSVDRRWDLADIATLVQLTTDDFEVVDTSDLMVSVDSMAVRQPGA